MTDSNFQPVENWDINATWDTFRNGLFHGVIMGVEIQKCDDDLDRYRELIEISQPDIVVETGTRAGGSALWFYKEMGLQVVSIDIRPQWLERGAPYMGRGIEWMIGSSIADHTIQATLPFLQGKRVMVSLDSDHHSAHVQAEIAQWAPFVTPGCYMVVEDACFDLFDRAGEPEHARVGGAKIPEYGGPLDAIERGMPRLSSTFWRDVELEKRTSISHSPVGYWRKHD